MGEARLTVVTPECSTYVIIDNRMRGFFGAQCPCHAGREYVQRFSAITQLGDIVRGLAPMYLQSKCVHRAGDLCGR